MANNTCLASLQACRLRVARLTAGGSPEEGDDNLYVTDALIQVQSSPEIEAGDEITQKTGCGDICVQFKDIDRIKRVTLSMELCQLDAELIEMLTGATVLTSGGDTVGFAIPPFSANPGSVSVEAWSKAWSGAEQETDDDDNPVYFRWVWPSTTWTLGQHTLENGVLSVPLTGQGVENSNYGLGAEADLPGTFPGAEAVFRDINIPDANCGYQALVLAGS